MIETAFTRINKHEDWFGDDDARWRFSAMYRCDGCGDPAFIVGHQEHFWVTDPETGDSEEITQLWPTFIEPAPHFFSIPKDCPEPIAIALKEAFSVFWSSPASAANQARVAVERLLDANRISGYKKAEDGKEIFVSLDQRIRKLEEKKPELARLLLAVKWIGNDGSHGDPVYHGDVLDGMEFIEHVLREIYPQSMRHLLDKADNINTNKGLKRASRYLLE